MALCFKSEGVEHLVKETFLGVQADKERELRIAVIVGERGCSQRFVQLIIRDSGDLALENMAHVFFHHKADKTAHKVTSDVFFSPDKTRAGFQGRFAHSEAALNAPEIAVHLHHFLSVFRRQIRADGVVAGPAPGFGNFLRIQVRSSFSFRDND